MLFAYLQCSCSICFSIYANAMQWLRIPCSHSGHKRTHTLPQPIRKSRTCTVRASEHPSKKMGASGKPEEEVVKREKHEKDEIDEEADATAEATEADLSEEDTGRNTDEKLSSSASVKPSKADQVGIPDGVEDVLLEALQKFDIGSSTPILDSFDLSGIAKKIKAGECKNIIVMGGAGISVSAGIPDFRTPGSGLYSKLEDYGLPHPEAVFELNFFKKNPEPFYRLAKELYPKGNFKPTPAHYFIRLLHDKGLLLRCFTQNIDSLETHAGLPADKLVAAHGNFDSATCITNGRKVPLEEVEKAIFEKDKGWEYLKKKYGGLVKPDIVFFGENLPRRFFVLAEEDFPKCDLLIVMGTSLIVQPFASLIGKVEDDCPRLLINREKLGQVSLEYALMGLLEPGFRFDHSNNYRDALFLGDCDKGVTELCNLLGWREDLDKYTQQ